MSGAGQAYTADMLNADILSLAERAFESYPDATSFEDFGPYVIQQPLGRGGMGEVFLAYDRSTDRQIAIKFLCNIWSTPVIQERFQREIQNLAKLEHPFIARLYDAGVHPCGAAYFTMQFAPGKPLDTYCRESRPPLDARVRLFFLMCQAVEYAHTHLIVHCDLKPSNILVENQGALKLVDFGISRQAAALDQPAATTQSLAGFTPIFAAPEQVRGQAVGLYTDVYALGVILYQLLTGTLPAAADTPAAALRYLSSDEEPEKPSAVAARRGSSSGPARQAWADLDALCLKALQKDPGRRYGSVSALAQDVERYFSGKPLSVQRDSYRYRAGKFLRRNRTPVIAAASVALAIAGMVGFFTARLARERDRANLETAAVSAMNRFLTDDLLAQADPFTSGTSQQSFVDAVSQAIPRIDGQFGSQPLIAARLHQAVAEAFVGRYEFDRARPEYQHAEHLFLQAEGPRSQDAIAVSLRRAAMEALTYTPANLDAAKFILASAVAGISGIPHPRPDLLVRLQYDRAVISVGSHDLQSANAGFAAALAGAQAIPSFPESELLRMKETYAYSVARIGQPQKAEPLLRQVIAAYQGRGESGASLLRARTYLAQSLLLQNRFAEALAEADAIYPEVLNKLGPNHQMTISVLGARAAAEGSLGHWDDAIRDDMAMFQIVSRKQGPNSTLAAEALSDEALSQCRSGRLADGLENAQRAFTTARRGAGAQSPFAGAVAYTVATCLCLSNQLDEAARILNTIDAPAVAQLIGDPTFPAGIELTQADLAFRRGDYSLARQKLAAAGSTFLNPSADFFERQRFARLAKALSGPTR